MNDRAELLLVLNQRNEAAKILRQHNETAGQTGAIYAAAARHVGVFRDALRQSGYDATALAGAVRTVGTLITNMARPTMRAAEEVDGLSRGFEVTRDALQDVTAGTAAQERAQSSLAAAPSPMAGSTVTPAARRAILDQQGNQGAIDGLARIVRLDSQGSEVGRATDTAGSLFDGFVEVRRTLAAVRAAAAGLPDRTAVGPQSDLATAHGAYLGGQVAQSRLDLPAELPGSSAADRTLIAVAIGDLKTALGTMFRSPPDLARTDGSTAVVRKRDLSDGGRDRVRSGDSLHVDLEPLTDPLRRILEVSIGLRHDLQNRRSSSQPEPTERTERTTHAVSLAPKDDELDLERLRDELRERLRAEREVWEAVEGGTWTRDYRATVRGPLDDLDAWQPIAVARQRSDQPSPDWGPTGTSVRETAEDWQAYGDSLAKALGATDQALAAILTQTKDWRSAMHGLINTVVADFARIAVRQNVTGPLADMVLGSGTRGDGPGILGRAWSWITSLFAGGGVMTGHGPLPLRAYASGGIATSPQLALFGEGSTPEAYVPVPNGRIPVTLRGGMGVGSVATSIVINVTGGGGAGETAVGADPTEQARNIGAMVTAAFNRNLAEQMRPGGLLNPAGYLGSGLAH